MGGSNLDGLHHRVHPVSDPPAPKLADIGNTSLPISAYAARVVRWALTPEGRHRKMAVIYKHFLVGLFVALPGLAYAENAGPPPVPRFEPAPCPKLPGAEELAKANCGFLVVPENRSRPSGRTIRLMVANYPARALQKRADPVVYLA